MKLALNSLLIAFVLIQTSQSVRVLTQQTQTMISTPAELAFLKAPATLEDFPYLTKILALRKT